MLRDTRRWLANRPEPLEGHPLSTRWWCIAITTAILILLLRFVDHTVIEAVHTWPRNIRTTLSWLTEWGGSQPYFVAAVIWIITLFVAGKHLATRTILNTLFAIIATTVVLFSTDASTRERATWIITSILILALTHPRADRRVLSPVLTLALCVAASGITVNILKPLFGHTRPRLWIADRLDTWQPFTFGYDYGSFPSGHATTAGAVAASIALALPAWRIPMLMIAATVAATRIGTISHYPSDTLAGLWLGWITPGLIAHIAAHTTRR